MKASPVKQIPIAEHNLDIGKFTIYPNIIVCEFNEGVHIDFENAAYPIQIAQLAFGAEKPLVYVSHRRNSYSWNPVQYREVITLFPNFTAFAIVSKNKTRQMLGTLESLFMKKPIGIFENINEAVAWAEEILEKTI